MHILLLRLKPEFSWNCKSFPKKDRIYNTFFFFPNSLLSLWQLREKWENSVEIQKAIKERIKSWQKLTAKLAPHKYLPVI